MTKFNIELEIPDNELPDDKVEKVFMVNGMITESLEDCVIENFRVHDTMIMQKFSDEDI